MVDETRWWRWFILCVLENFVRSQVQQRSIIHSYYAHYPAQPQQNYRPANQPAYRAPPNYYGGLRRRPYPQTPSHNYHSRAGYFQQPLVASQPPQTAKVHSIIYANRMNPYHGDNRIHTPGNQWAEWSAWSKCSKPCNGGVKTRIRGCLSHGPGQYSGNGYALNRVEAKGCVGYSRDYQACNTQVCMTKVQRQRKKLKLREAECQGYNNVVYQGESYTWKPYMRAGLSECKLICLADGHRIFRSFGYVTDGVICGHEDGFTCQGGHCRQMKHHDVHLNETKPIEAPTLAKKKEPVKKWIHVKKSFQRRNGMRIGYNHLLRLPRGAVNITIKEETPSNNYFALKMGEVFILNARWQVKTNKRFYAASSVFKYTLDKRKNGETTEKIEAPGPLSEEVDVLVVYKRSVVNISYQYHISRITLTNPIPFPLRQPSHNLLSRGVSHYPPQRRRYQQATHHNSAPYRYTPGILGSKTGYGGVRPPPQLLPPPPNPSLHQGRPNPAMRQVRRNPAMHQVRPNPAMQQVVAYKWRIGGITLCSAKCNGGEQEYTYRCFASSGSSGKFVDDSNCANVQRPPPKKRMCNLQDCPVKWYKSEWSACPRTCGMNDTQYREVKCMEGKVGGKTSENQEVHHSKCTGFVKPPTMRKCQFVPCKYSWKIGGQWSACSATCDYGVQRRHVYCENSNKVPLPLDRCSKATKPPDSRECLNAHCSTAWFASEWSMCSSACEQGEQTRRVVCRSSAGLLLSETFCKNEKKPLMKMTCKGTACDGAFWVMSAWTKCSSNCGGGMQYREVFCANLNNNVLAHARDNFCLTPKPNHMKLCENKNCNPIWYHSNWGECSASCGRGIRHRQRICLTTDGKLGRGCYYKYRPARVQFCRQPSCTSSLMNVASVSKVVKKKAYTITALLEAPKPYQQQLTSENESQKTALTSTTMPTTTATTTTIKPPRKEETSRIKVIASKLETAQRRNSMKRQSKTAPQRQTRRKTTETRTTSSRREMSRMKETASRASVKTRPPLKTQVSIRASRPQTPRIRAPPPETSKIKAPPPQTPKIKAPPPQTPRIRPPPPFTPRIKAPPPQTSRRRPAPPQMPGKRTSKTKKTSKRKKKSKRKEKSKRKKTPPIKAPIPRQPPKTTQPIRKPQSQTPGRGRPMTRIKATKPKPPVIAKQSIRKQQPETPRKITKTKTTPPTTTTTTTTTTTKKPVIRTTKTMNKKGKRPQRRKGGRKVSSKPTNSTKCFNRYSTKYCKVISRLRLCRKSFFQRVCCSTCKAS